MIYHLIKMVKSAALIDNYINYFGKCLTIIQFVLVKIYLINSMKRICIKL